MARSLYMTAVAGGGDGFETLIDADFTKTPMALAADGVHNVGSVDLTFVNLATTTTKEVTLADGIHLVSGNPGAHIEVALDTVLAAVGHTWSVANYQYLFAIHCERGSVSGNGNMLDWRDATQNERFMVGQRQGYVWMFQRGVNAWTNWSGTLGPSVVVVQNGHAFDLRHGTVVDPATWDGDSNAPGMARWGDSERSFENTNQSVTTTSVPNTGTSPQIQLQPRGVGDWIKFKRLIIKARVRP